MSKKPKSPSRACDGRQLSIFDVLAKCYYEERIAREREENKQKACKTAIRKRIG